MRDKLIEIIGDAPYGLRTLGQAADELISVERIADHLISNGVTFADVPDTNVGDKPMTNADRIRTMTNEQLKDFLEKFRVETYTEPFGKAFCKNCPTTEGTVEGKMIPLRLHECDFADGVCPHGDALSWWLSQTEEVEE